MKLKVHLDKIYKQILTMGDKDKITDVILPTDLATNKLTLEEIGSIFILMALPHLESDHGWDKDEKLKGIIEDFFNRGILTSTTESDGGVNVEIDLDKV